MINSPEIESIIEQAIESAKTRKQQYVTVEHLLLALITYPPFKKCVGGFGADIDTMEQEITAYLDSLHAIISATDEVTPRKTNSLERVINRSVTQVLFTGRRQVTTIDLYLSIASEGNSHAHYFLLKYGISKNEFALSIGNV
jgi:ATP-dependent Clp protease ATP-binding subunit ClpA